MKKLFLIAAALTTMVSCSKTQVIPEQTAQQEISMKAYNQAAVKATGPVDDTKIESNHYDEQISVYASYSQTGTSYSSYLDGAFEYDNTKSNWKGVTSYYWPYSGFMKFFAVFPVNYPTSSTTNISYSYSTTPSNVLTTKIDNIDLSSFEDQKDIMYSQRSYTTPAQWTDNTVPTPELVFKHLLSQVILNVKSDHNTIKVHSASLLNVILKGDIKIEQADSGDPTITTPSYSSTNDDLVIFNADDTDADLTNNSIDLSSTSQTIAGRGALVFPYMTGSVPQLSITYSTGNGDSITRTVNLTEEWLAGYKYIYEITITMQEIRFTTDVTPWSDGPISTPSEDLNI